MNSSIHSEGFSLVEVMMAMVVSGIAFLGAMGAVEVGSRYVRQGSLSGKALELAEARLEVKRSVRWQLLLEDDLDHDGISETIMKDDGHDCDQFAGDGIYTAMEERDGLSVVWTIQGDRPGPLSVIGMVTIRATATYVGPGGPKEISVATLRANPGFVGHR